MDYDPAAVHRVVGRAVGERDDVEPGFYAVGGSHGYGFATAESDVDVRGFHVADGERYALLDEPDAQFAVNRDGVTPGFESEADVELVSYELKTFGRLVWEGNFDVLELVCCGERVVDEVPGPMADLRALVEAHLPLNVPASYVGMARTNYRKHVAPAVADDETAAPTAKRVLYVLRGLLAARYVLAEGTLEADVRTLADRVLGDTDLVDDLLAVRRSGGSERVPDDLAPRADERITALFEELDPPERGAEPAFRDAVDEWMLSVRAETGPI